jgi:hypothetical protein
MGNFYKYWKRNKEKVEVKVAFQRRRTLQNILKLHPQIDRCEKNGVYEMKCLDFPLKYSGQMGQTFYVRYKEYIQATKNV